MERTAQSTETARGCDIPVLEVRGGTGGLSLATLNELFVFREVLMALILRHVKVKYKQASVGIAWALIQPLLSAALLALFLGRIVRIPSEGVPYVLFALAGTTAWTYFSTGAGTAMESLVSDQAILRKVYFPREVLPLAAVGAALVDLAAGLGALFVVALIFGIGPSLSWIWLPLPILLLIVTATALGLGLSAPNVYYRDVRYALPFLLQLGMLVSPVIYPLSKIPDQWRTLYAIANPVAAAIDGLRRTVLHHTQPDLGVTFAALAWSIVLLVVSYSFFKRVERGFADRV